MLIGRGRTAEVFAWDDRRALKLYYAGWPASEAAQEARIAHGVYRGGLAAPAVHAVIEVKGRYGIIYDRVDGMSLLHQITSQPWAIRRSAHRLAELHAAIHACRVPELPSQRQRLERQILAVDALPAIMKDAVLHTLHRLPDDTVVCHGDFHPDNVVLSPRGPIVLDWRDATRGNPLADVARTSLLLSLAAIPAGTPGRWFIEAGRALFHRLYLRRYLHLRPASSQELAAWRLPVAAARMSEGIAAEQERLLALIRALPTD